jgi:TonB family protein
MSTIEPDDRFVSEEELSALLKKWQSPQPSAALDKRVTSSYLQEMSQSVMSDSVQLPKTDNEVVKMKFCSVCQEEFAEKFSFCPVDATPLTSVARVEEPSVTSVPSNGGVVLSPEPEAPLAQPVPRPVVAPRAQAPQAQVKQAAGREEFHFTFLNDTGLATRLGGELKDVAHEYELTWPEFKRDPKGFMKRSAVGYGQIAKRFFANRNVVVAMSVAIFAMIAVAAIVLLLDKSRSALTGRIGIIAFAVIAFSVLVAMFATWLGKERGAPIMGAQASDSRTVAYGMVAAFVFIFAILAGLVLMNRGRTAGQSDVALNEEEVQQIIDIPQDQPTPEPGTAGFNKGSGGGSKPKQEKAGGGGGGGRNEATPASAGKLPQASLETPQILPPDPKPPVVKNPSLPVAATVNADPMLVPPDARVLPYGDPKSRSTTPSSGPGSGNGIGNGTGTGVGSGEGNGVGPGRGGNIGGGDMHPGGGGPGGGGEGGDYKKVFTGKDVTSKARVLSKPEPQYTEEARKNQIVGTVLLQAVFSASGEVTQIRALRPLPYGLTEKAIAAARMIKFVPATKDGHPVSMYMHLEYNFNLY